MSGRIIATAANQWHLKAKIGATIVQESVLSLKPVTTRIDDSVDRRIIKGRDNAVQKSELELNEDHFIEHELDLGAIFFESIALSIPIFPKEKGESFEREISMDEINSIFRGKTKSTKEYVWGGIKIGALVSVGIGGFFTLLALTDGGGTDAFLCGGLMALFSGIYTVPGGALLGFIRAKVAEGKAVEYVIGEGNWTIVTP